MPGAAGGEGNASTEEAANTDRAPGPLAGKDINMCLVLLQRVFPWGSVR